MNIELLDLLGSAAGGFLGAAFGPLISFVLTGFAIFTGVAILVGGESSVFLDTIAFGPFFGPHIAFAGGVGALAYAARKGWVKSGHEIFTPLASLGKPSVPLVGSVFGMFGYVFLEIVKIIPWFGANTEAIAFVLIVSAILARLLFGRTGLIGAHSEGLQGWKKFIPTKDHVWLPYQQNLNMIVPLGLFIGGITAWGTVTLLMAHPHANGVVFLGFGISALSLIFLPMGFNVPVTHHITLVSAIAASAFLTKLPDQPVVDMLIAAVFGALASILCEGFSRLWQIRGDTHIDPPASSIWPMTTVIVMITSMM